MLGPKQAGKAIPFALHSIQIRKLDFGTKHPAFAFVNFARFAVPLRIGLALSTTPWIDENIVKKFIKKDENNCEEPEA